MFFIINELTFIGMMFATKSLYYPSYHIETD